MGGEQKIIFKCKPNLTSLGNVQKSSRFVKEPAPMFRFASEAGILFFLAKCV